MSSNQWNNNLCRSDKLITLHHFLQVQMPGVTCITFRQLLHYLYSDRIPPVQPMACVPLIELANRLCLPRLVQLVENHMVAEMQRIIDAGGEVTMECLTLLEPCQVSFFELSASKEFWNASCVV